jgi:LA2681-like HEPN
MARTNPTSHIDSPVARETAHHELAGLLTAGDGRAAIAYTRGLTASAEWVWARDELRAVTLIDVGSRDGRIGDVEQGLDLLRTTFPNPTPETAYNIANGEDAIWQHLVRPHNWAGALAKARKRQAAARATYAEVGQDLRVDQALRVQALVNLGNSYDNQGRDLDALAAWRAARAIAPDFAMADGNIGVALHGIASFAAPHQGMILLQAARALDRALAKEADILRIGGPGALRHFRAIRDAIGPVPDGVATHGPDPPAEPWQDPHLDWCRRHELFLHVSPECQREDDEHLDALSFAALYAGFDEASQRRLDELVDAFNVLKRDYVAARYLMWLVTDPDAAERPTMDAASRRVTWIDTLTMSRWGVRTGVLVHAFAAATNVLDKVAVYTHLYFGTHRPSRTVYFRGFWHMRNKPEQWEPEFEAALTAPCFNRGLIALADLACDLEADTTLSGLLQRRHVATHRFLVAHDQLLEPEVGAWLEREEWETVVDGSLQILRFARAALIYLTRAVDVEESRRAAEAHAANGGRQLPTLNFHTTNPDLNEIE